MTSPPRPWWATLAREAGPEREPAPEREPGLKSVLRTADLSREALIGISSRPGRSLLTMLGALVGVSAFAAVIGLANTTRAQVNGQFNQFAATEVVISDTESQPDTLAFPANTEQLLSRLRGVTSSGVLFQASTPQAPGVTRLAPGPGQHAANSIEVAGATPGVFRVAQGALTAGRYFDGADSQEGGMVTVLGSAAAAQLHIGDISAEPAVFIDGVPFTVVGILKSVRREPSLLQEAIVPAATAVRLWGVPSGSDAIIAVRPGSASVVAGEAPIAIAPADPSRLAAVSASGALPLQSAVNGDLSELLLLAGIISLGLGMIGIASVTLTSVLERYYEIGVRRALGATRRQIITQFLAESVILGTIGGIAGTCLAVIAIVLIAGQQHWLAVFTPGTIAPDPLIGSIAGCLAGIYPAVRAGNLDPVEALRRQ
jgi:putative ABC transport system permease protein